MVRDRLSKDEGNNVRHGGGYKKKRRLGGGGLSLAAFAAAKSKPTVNPAQIRQKREFYQNAKKIRKYRKLVNDISGKKEDGGQEPTSGDLDTQGEGVVSSEEPVRGTEVSGRGDKHRKARGKNQRPRTQLEILQEEFNRKKSEEEIARKEKEEAGQAQKVARDNARKVRKDLQAKMRKKTRSGQPIMKHRLEHLLDSIQRSS